MCVHACVYTHGTCVSLNCMNAALIQVMSLNTCYQVTGIYIRQVGGGGWVCVWGGGCVCGGEGVCVGGRVCVWGGGCVCGGEGVWVCVGGGMHMVLFTTDNLNGVCTLHPMYSPVAIRHSSFSDITCTSVGVTRLSCTSVGWHVVTPRLLTQTLFSSCGGQ